MWILEFYEKFKEIKPYFKDATKIAKVTWQFQAGVYAARIITEGKILDLKNKIRANNKELDKLTQELDADANAGRTNSGFKELGGGSFGGGGAGGTWKESPNAKSRVKTAAEIKKEQIQKKMRC